MGRFLIFIFLLSNFSSSFGQNKRLDSLFAIYNNTKADTSRAYTLFLLSRDYKRNGDYQKALAYANEELSLCQELEKSKDPIVLRSIKKEKGRCYNNLGNICEDQSNYSKALEYYSKALTIFLEAGNKKAISACYGNIGIVYDIQANYVKALSYYLKDLKIEEEMLASANLSKDRIEIQRALKGIGACYNNIGVVYDYQSNYPKALEHYSKSLKCYQECGYKKGIAACDMNIGNVYSYLLNYDKALEYYLNALAIYKDLNDKKGIGISYGNIGEVYADQNNYAKGLDYQFMALKIYQELGDKQGEAKCYDVIGQIYTALNNGKEALKYNEKSLSLAKEIGDIERMRTAYQSLATHYANSKNYEAAYINHVKFKKLTDSIFNEDNSKQLGDLKTQFEVEKKEAELKIKTEAQQAISVEEKKKQQIIIYSVAGMLFLVIIFSVFLYNRFRITQKQKKIIEEQKILVDSAYESLHEKNKEVMDSIHYARRIQRALITSEKYIESRLNRLMRG